MSTETNFQPSDQSNASASSRSTVFSALSSDMEAWKDFTRRDITRELEIVDINKKLSVITADISGLKTEMIELRSEFNSKLDKLESSFNGKLDKLENSFNGKLDKLENNFNGKLDKLENSFNGKLDKLESSFDLKFEAFKSDIKADINASNTWKNPFIIGIFVALIGILMTFWIKLP
ncbi:MAG: hypothetical protein LBP22_12590 [Deltaproteobacteria bacterium]|jgi:predicted  nucleic acid-binding Zn-ribbon protein|nr:hypothetical protein [Deltaproteobacteria bacterium]